MGNPVIDPQPAPIPSNGIVVRGTLIEVIADDEKTEVERDVLKDIVTRLEADEKKYGVPLTAENGRDADVDLYQELLDAMAYGTQTLLEAKDVKDANEKIEELAHLGVIAEKTRLRLVRRGVLPKTAP